MEESGEAMSLGEVTSLNSEAKRKLIQMLIVKAAEQLAKDSGKPTMSDLVRLLNLEKELGLEQPTEITVQWIDPRTGEPWRPED